MRIIISILMTLTVFITQTSFAAETNSIDAAIANKSRPEDHKKLDENRRPKELLTFSKVKAGDTVVDFFPGQGYFTRLFSSVVGPKGKVIAHVPKEVENAFFKPVEAGKKGVEGLKNAELKILPMTTAPASNVDIVWTSANYHDVHIKSLLKTDAASFNKLVFNMLKPGGYYIVVDHVANPKATVADIEKLHRIDPAQVRKEIEAAGFVFEEESKVLAHKEDHKLNVFDPAIRGKTDQFAYRFVKPKK